MSCGEKAISKFPIIITTPPKRSDFLNPKILSAKIPPKKVKAYTNACIAPYLRFASLSDNANPSNLSAIKMVKTPRIP